MHMGIAVIVYAPNQEEATIEAKKIADDLCVNQDPFDYHADFSVDSRFEGLDFSKALPHTDKRVADLLDKYHIHTKQTFMVSLERLREALDKNDDDELWKSNDDMWRYYANQIGMYKGSAIHVYDGDGEGIRDDRHLANVLGRWHCIGRTSYDNLGIYVYFQDVHY